jgi:hypothetical protein
MAWRRNADATRHPAEDDTMIIPYCCRCAQGPEGAWSPQGHSHRLLATDRRRDPPISTPQSRRAARW